MNRRNKNVISFSAAFLLSGSMLFGNAGIAVAETAEELQITTSEDLSKESIDGVLSTTAEESADVTAQFYWNTSEDHNLPEDFEDWPFLGIYTDDYNRVLDKTIADDILPFSMAEYVGFMPGDRIVSINDMSTDGWAQLGDVFSVLHPGDPAVIVIERSGARVTFEMTMGSLRENERLTAEYEEMIANRSIWYGVFEGLNFAHAISFALLFVAIGGVGFVVGRQSGKSKFNKAEKDEFFRKVTELKASEENTANYSSAEETDN